MGTTSVDHRSTNTRVLEVLERLVLLVGPWFGRERLVPRSDVRFFSGRNSHYPIVPEKP